MINNDNYKKYNLNLSDETKINEFIKIINSFNIKKSYIIVFRLISPIITYKDIKKKYDKFRVLFFDKKESKKMIPELFLLLNNGNDLSDFLDDWPCFTIERKFLYFINKEKFYIDKFNNEEIYSIITNNDTIDISIENTENSEYFYDLTIYDNNYMFLNFAKVFRIINLWDPIGLIKNGLNGNYNNEIVEIYDKLLNKENELSYIIYELFKKNYPESFSYTLNDCFKVANEIIKL